MVETWDVMVPNRWFVLVTVSGMRLEAHTDSLRNAVVMAQELLGGEDHVMAVWDGNNIYVIEWEN